MKRALIALAGLPVLSLIASAALADLSQPPNPSGNGITPVPGEIKNRNQCHGAAFFKNQFPSLTNGNPGGSATNNYTVDGQNVTVTVTWDEYNSFGFTVSGGYAKRIGVTVDQNNFIYDYSVPPASPLDGVADTLLNYYEVGGTRLMADDVNHLDLCLEVLDTIPPVVGDIIVMPVIDDNGTDPATVTGPITIMSSISDESDQSVMIEIFQVVDGMEVSIDTSLIMGPSEDACDPAALGCTKYTWSIDTDELEDGVYTVRVTSADDTVLGLSNFKTKDIEVITVLNLEGCLEGDDAIPGGEDGIGGCQEAGVTLEYPEALRGQLEPQPVTQVGVPARRAYQTVECGLAPDGVTVLDPFVVKDPRVNTDGSVMTVGTQDLNQIFEINETLADLGVGPYVIELPDHLYGAICLSLYYQQAPNFDDLASLLPPDFFLGFSLSAFQNDPAGSPRPISVLTEAPEDILGMYAGSPRMTAPLNFCDRADPGCGVLPGCFDDPSVDCFQPSQQFIERAVVQADENWLHVRPFAFDGTFEVYNRSRTKSFKGTFGVLNTRRVCPALEDPSSPLVPGTPAYLAAELDCMVLQTLEVFYDTETAIKEADARGNLLGPDVNRLLNPHSKALGQIKNQHFERALRYLDDLLDQIYRASWNIDANNDPGRLIMMVTALRFQVEQHLATESCLEDQACLAILD